MQNVGNEKVTVKRTTVRLENGAQLDLGAIGKGYVGGEAVRILNENRVNSALIDIVGNIQLAQ